jgi:hypothetical protein
MQLAGHPAGRGGSPTLKTNTYAPSKWTTNFSPLRILENSVGRREMKNEGK